MDELLPVLVARLHGVDEAIDVVSGSLVSATKLLPVEPAPADDGAHVLELHARGLNRPLLLIAEPVGPAKAGLWPLRVRPFDEAHAEQLRAFLVNEELRAFLGEAASESSSRRHTTAPIVGDSLPPGSAPIDDPLIGRVLGGKYEIESVIASGAMGRVYRAHHRALEKPIAVKVLRRSFLADPSFARRFHREALAASRLDHPNLLRVIDYGEEPGKILYIVMELLEGEELRSVMHHQRLSRERVIEIASQVCAGLAAAHAKGIVHRDVKPENVVVCTAHDDDGRSVETVKVCDFGIAMEQENEGPTRARITGGDILWGTPEYMSPEQARGLIVDARADVYACGVLLYEMATRKLPFDGPSAVSVMMAQVQDRPTPPSEIDPSVDPALEAVILRALEKSPSARYQSARELRAALRALEGGSSARLPQVRPSLELEPFPRSERPDRPHPIPPPRPAEPVDTVQAFSGLSDLSEARAESVALDAEATLAALDAALDPGDFVREVTVLVGAAAALARRGDAEGACAIAARFRLIASEPSERASIAKTGLGLLSEDVLATIARQLLTGEARLRDVARQVLVVTGERSARVLVAARGEGDVERLARVRFVDTLRDIGTRATPAIAAALDATPGAALAEDLLRALSPVADAKASAIVARFLQHAEPSVRRAAAAALPSTWGPRAKHALATLLDDADDGVRAAALTGLRKIGAIDEAVVRHVERVLTGASPASEELRAVAAAVLGDVAKEARPLAMAALLRALQPRTRSFLSRFTGGIPEDDARQVIEAVARALVSIGGAEGRTAVEKRANSMRGELRDALLTIARAEPR
jgi:serine/threonine-protein kinase